MPKSSRKADDTSLLSSSPPGKLGYTDDENNPDVPGPGLAFGVQETPVGKTMNAQGHESSLITPPDSGSAASNSKSPSTSDPRSTTASFTFSFDSQPSTRLVTSEWETRAQSASPAATLARHAAQGREKKKTQFLDRIRRRRDDSRSEMYGDQVLRMDFVRERKQWEDEMRQRALVEAGIGSDEGEDADMPEQEQTEMSPTVEHDVDELMRHLEEAPGIVPRGDDDEFLVDDDDEYDHLFREIILQSQGQSEIQDQNQNPQAAEQTRAENQLQQDDAAPFNSSMDLS
ncbi:uncharacterized protein Z518_05928 [Rhinocladiella mackenziei CBS 650.93]|uniref:Uncharacterized protein n=1 Tax=Rhinocladiella mackenziei CBS 650.93 TaxID=1442369 RepID=A0A0D2IPJ0_9EURO|nr:uncharacterized protein Z518_05928 [Rhinocladiella mackenziei CBS 650.93]KIX05056.1 hypothetical protein Z518_05928 [Rhinocladiella mackenziei CBS 650.93]